jgi:hypothetical protein
MGAFIQKYNIFEDDFQPPTRQALVTRKGTVSLDK